MRVRSLGLVVSPRIRFLQKHNKVQQSKRAEIGLEADEAREPDKSQNNRKTLFQQPQNVPRGKETYDFGGGKI